MTRLERAEQLVEMLTTEDGIDRVEDTFLYEFPEMAGSTFGMSYAEMIEGILDAEYPLASPAMRMRSRWVLATN